MNNFNFLWLGESKKYLNMALVTDIDIEYTSESNIFPGSDTQVVVWVVGKEDELVFVGPDAERIIEYLKRNAYH